MARDGFKSLTSPDIPVPTCIISMHARQTFSPKYRSSPRDSERVYGHSSNVVISYGLEAKANRDSASKGLEFDTVKASVFSIVSGRKAELVTS